MTLKILIIDAQPVMRAGIVHIMKKNLKSIQVSEAQDFYEAIALANNKKFDLIVLGAQEVSDNGMKITRIFSFLRQRFKAAKILVFSGHNPHLFKDEFLSAGADAFLHKSSSVSEMDELVRTLLRQSSVSDEELMEQHPLILINEN